MNAIRRIDGGYELSAAIRWAAGLVAMLLVAALGNGLYLWREHGLLVSSDREHHFSIAELQDGLADVVSKCQINTVNRERNEKTIAWLEQQVYALRQDPTARPDKFSGTDGREMEQRLIKRLEALEKRP